VSKVRDWEDWEDEEEDLTFEKFSHKAKLIKQRKEDAIRQKRREKQEFKEYEKKKYEQNAYEGEI
jgi:hypothetical protein